ncbi:MAG TPA: hypothetical protein VJR04_13745 [Terriglobales bacterium]|nr:hypothetical protein [Terriglobales bacterium]
MVRKVSITGASIVLAMVCMGLAGGQSTSRNVAARVINPEHQRGNIPILEGHEVHKFSILVSQRLTPGRHEIGDVNVGAIGAVRVAVLVDASGKISQIEANWPSQVKPELISSTTHPVYLAILGQGIRQVGEAHCELTHAAGSCNGCSTFNWLEVTQLTNGMTLPR